MTRPTRLLLPLLLLAAAACGGRAAAPSPPSGQAAVAYAGVQVFVPAGWPRNRLQCGVPTENTVVVDPGPLMDCALVPPPVVSYAWLRTSGDLTTDPEAVVATRPVRFQGHPARRGEDRLADGRTRDVLVVPARKIVVIAVSADPALARSIVDSAFVA